MDLYSIVRLTINMYLFLHIDVGFCLFHKCFCTSRCQFRIYWMVILRYVTIQVHKQIDGETGGLGTISQLLPINVSVRWTKNLILYLILHILNSNKSGRILVCIATRDLRDVSTIVSQIHLSQKRSEFERSKGELRSIYKTSLRSI